MVIFLKEELRLSVLRNGRLMEGKKIKDVSLRVHPAPVIEEDGKTGHVATSNQTQS